VDRSAVHFAGSLNSLLLASAVHVIPAISAKLIDSLHLRFAPSAICHCVPRRTVFFCAHLPAKPQKHTFLACCKVSEAKMRANRHLSCFSKVQMTPNRVLSCFAASRFRVILTSDFQESTESGAILLSDFRERTQLKPFGSLKSSSQANRNRFDLGFL
jgi:hypothetical protein